MNKYKSMGLINIKKYMKQAGLQSKEVADKMNVRPETVSRWVSGTNNPGLDQAGQLAEILGVSMADILFQQRGMQITGSSDYDGNVTFYDTMQDKKYLPMPGMDTPKHRFVLQFITHQQEDQHSYHSFSNLHIKEKVVSSTCFTMRSLVKIKSAPEEAKKYIGRTMIGVLYPLPPSHIDKDSYVKYNVLLCQYTRYVIKNLEIEWATPLLSQFYNRNQSEVLDMIDVEGHDS